MAKRTRQLVLDLRETPRWGGRRAGAGRKCGPSPRHDHRARAPLARCHPCHVTLRVRRGLPSLRSGRLVRELERSLAAACERGRFRLVQYSLQHDHVHALVEATSERDLACGMKSIGSRLARAVNRVFALRGAVLADRYHLHFLRTPREVRNALAFLRLESKIPTAIRSHHPARRTTAHVAPPRRLAPPRAHRSRRGAGRTVTRAATARSPLLAQTQPGVARSAATRPTRDAR
jgi:REP-associated tyrosine transposase